MTHWSSRPSQPRVVHGDRFSRLVFGALLGIVFLLPLPYGSNVSWAVALMGVAVFSLLALWTILYVAGRVHSPEALLNNRWVLALWIAWLLWIGWQLIPISGAAISVLRENTYQALLKSASYFGLYLLVLLTCTSRSRLRLLALVIVLAGLVQAIYGSVMVLSGMEFGFLERKTTQLGRATGTFINRNHLAGYLEICAAVAVGLVAADLGRQSLGAGWRHRLRDIIDAFLSTHFRVRIALGMMVIGLVLTQSRMGNIAYFAALLVCGLLYVLLRERRLFIQSLLILGSVFVVDLLIVSEWFGLERLVGRLEQTDVVTERRTYIVPELAQAVSAYLPYGAGLGNFSIAVLPFRKVARQDFYDHAHNDYAEFLIEVGFPGFFLLAALVLVTAVHALKVVVRRRNRLRTGIALSALVAMTAIAIHSAVDFNLQIPANAATLVIVMAMVNSCSDRPRKHHAEPPGASSAGEGDKGLSTT